MKEKFTFNLNPDFLELAPLHLGRKPLFPGKDYIHQMRLIIQVLGSPAEEDLMFIQSHKVGVRRCKLTSSP